MNITLTTAANCQFTFAPVRVSRGRKFRGFGYFITSYDSSFHLAGWSSRGGWIYGETAKLWNPETKKICYANADFCEDVDQDQSITLSAKAEYIKHTLENTLEFCRSHAKNPNDENDVNRFARNVIRKNHPEMLSVFDEAIKIVDTRDIVAEVQKTVQWALTLRTQPCYMYGRHCAGGKMYAPKRYVEIALKALQKRQLDKLDGFNDVFTMVLDLHDLPHPVMA